MNLFVGDKALNNYLKKGNIAHYSVAFDLMEYDFKRVYKSFNLSYFSKDKGLSDHNFVDSEELMNYEEIESLTDNLLVVLIKKFKLRLSFRENTDFSRDIIICDDYALDPNKLKFHDSILKIAIVRDNLDKWGHLNDYDYIFTFEEYVKELKGHGQVFQIEDKPVYNQIKFVLNELYRRKDVDFYHFVKFIKFHDIFPPVNDYFKVLHSVYFDDQWYHDTYGLEENTDSVTHFLLMGYSKDYSPGPNFDTKEFYKCNLDIKLKDLNPLLYYEQYGEKENRKLSCEGVDKKYHDIIANSEYFDKDWYESTYELTGEFEDAADHYLNIGYDKRYNPSRKFSTHEYYERNKDIKRSGVNPLLHYEIYGKEEGRKMCLSDKEHQWDYDLISKSEYFDREWYLNQYDDLNGYDDPVLHYLYVGYAKRYNPGPVFNTQDYLDCNDDVEKHGMNPLLHYERYGIREGRDISDKD